MGSPVSVVLAELTMQKFESIALSNPPCEPLFWKRYVDDIITALPTSQITNFLNHLNAINEHIQFTCEQEANNTIPFLDLLITRRNDGHLRFSVYRKQTHTDKYLDPSSYHPISHKIATASTLLHRAESHCSEEYKKREINNVKESLALNGYKNNLISTCHRNLNRPANDQENDNSASTNNTERTSFKYVSVPYIRGASERVCKILRPHGIKLGHKPAHTLRSKLCSVKDRREQMDRNGVVYKIKCKQCDAEYIGETGKEMNKRITEHKNAVRRKDPLSAIYQHMRTTHHEMDWDGSVVLGQHPNSQRRQIIEASYTFNNPHALNRAVTLPTQYLPLISNLLGHSTQT
jgi:hypothetical protein